MKSNILTYLIFFLNFLPFVVLGQTGSFPEISERDVLALDNIVQFPSVKKQTITSAVRSSQNIEDLPVTCIVVTQEEIQKNGYISLVDVLKSRAGIRVSQPGSSEEGELFLMRGLLGNSYTKILINGIPIQPSVVTGMPLGAQLPIQHAERIEIIYGPASAVYGADAAAGVINIVTDRGDDNFYTQIDGGLGAFGYNHINFTVGGRAGKGRNVLKYMLYGSRTDLGDMNIRFNKDFVYHPLRFLDLVQGLESPVYLNQEVAALPLPIEDLNATNLAAIGIDPEQFVSNEYQPYYQGTVDRPEIGKMQHASRLLGLQLNFRNFQLSYDYLYRRDFSSIGRSPFFYSYSRPQFYIGEAIRRVTLSHDKSWNGVFNSKTNVSYLQHRLDNNSAYAVNYDNTFESFENWISYIYSASDDIFLEQLFSFYITNNVELLAGGSLQYSGNLPKTNEMITPVNDDFYTPFGTRQIEPHPFYGDFGYNPINFFNSAAFVQLYSKFNKLKLILGLRYDKNSRFKQTLNPRLAALYDLNKKTSVRASFGTAFKAPSTSIEFNSLALPIFPDSVTYPIIPNTNLQPEKFESFEIGVRNQISSKIYFDISGYFNQMENLIVPIVKPLNASLFPNSVANDITRTNVNSSTAKTFLFGIQGSLKVQDVIPSLESDLTLNFNFSKGEETLPEDHGKIDELRMMPKYMVQLQFSLSPTPKWYINLENTIMSSWLRRFINTSGDAENPLFRIDGYYTLDLYSSYKIGNQLKAFLRVKNLFDGKYGGIGVTGFDVDLLFNPQYGRNIQFGFNFQFD